MRILSYPENLMAATFSPIISDDQSEQIFSPLTATEIQEQTETSSSNIISTDLLSEILAIQEAIQNEANFDFTTLETTSAGNQQNSASPQSNDKTTSTPILLEDTNLLIHYRSDDSRPSNTLNQDNASQSSTQIFESDNDNSLLGIIENNTTTIQSSVSEDFITSTQGKFSTNLSIPEQNIQTSFGLFSSDSSGNWFYQLNNQLAKVQALAAGENMTDIINLTSTSGQKIQIALEINGTNDQAIVTGVKSGKIHATPIADLDNNHPSITGKLNVSDIDNGEARFQTNFDIQGSFGVAQINAQGEWTYTLNNHTDAVQGLRSGEKLLDLFSIKTLDGTKQLIQITIEGVDDKPLLSGGNASVLDLDTDLTTSGKLFINDPDFGESSFQQLTSIRSSLGYGSADIDTQGNWTFNLDIDYTKANTINEGLTVRDSFEVFTMDGTSQHIIVSIRGSNTPVYETSNTAATNADTLSVYDVIREDAADDLTTTLYEGATNSTNIVDTNQSASSSNLEATVFMNNSQDGIQTLNTHMNDLHIS